ncbi:hypothetical protein [Aliikangiella sp. IMCC44632]
MPLSTSNSNIEYREIPFHQWSQHLKIALIMLVVAVLAWEWLARKLEHTPGNYADGFDVMWAEERRKLDIKDHQIDVVILGSSRILWGTDLNLFEQQLATRPLQLALPGTSPALMFEDIVTNTDFNGVVLMGVTPGLFNAIGEGAFGGKALKTYRSETPSQWFGTRIYRGISDYFAFIDHAFSLYELLDHYLVLPERQGAKEPPKSGWKLGNIYHQRQTDMWAPVEKVGSFDNAQVTMFWQTVGMVNPIPAEKTAKMRESTVKFFAPLISQFIQRGGEVIFVMMPSSGPLLDAYKKGTYEKDVWHPMLETFDVIGINSLEYPQLSSQLETPEWSHLSRASQDKWSLSFIPILEDAYQKKYQKSFKKRLTKVE